MNRILYSEYYSVYSIYRNRICNENESDSKPKKLIVNLSIMLQITKENRHFFEVCAACATFIERGCSKNLPLIFRNNRGSVKNCTLHSKMNSPKGQFRSWIYVEKPCFDLFLGSPSNNKVLFGCDCVKKFRLFSHSVKCWKTKFSTAFNPHKITGHIRKFS
jgi:hypothetical protein